MLQSRSHLDFREKQRARRYLYSPLTFIVLAIMIVIAGRGAWGMYQKSRMTDDALAQTKEAYDALVIREAFLDSELERLSTESGVESEIRERFGVAKAGEEVIVVLSEEESVPPPLPEKGFWGKIKDWLAGTDDDYIKD
jgi:cell division protein FtsB